MEAATNTASEAIGPPPGTAPPWGRGHLDYASLEGDANRPGEQAELAATRDLGLWVPRLTAGEQLALAVSIRWLLTSRSRHLAEESRTMADVTFGHRTGHTPPATMDHLGQWHYVATRLIRTYQNVMQRKEEGARRKHSTRHILSTTEKYRFTSQVYSTFPFMVHLSLDFVLPISLH